MSSNEENNSTSSELPVERKRRKQWRNDPNQPVPRSTYYRLQQNLRDWIDLAENSRSEVSEIDDSNIESSEPDNATRSSNSLPDSNVEYRIFEVENEDLIEADEIEDDSRNLIHEDNARSTDFEDNMSSLVDDDNVDDSNDDFDIQSCGSLANLIIMLYDNSNISLIQSVLLLLNLYVTHKLTKSSLQGVLNFIQAILPQPNNMPRTLYRLFKFVEDAAVSTRIIKHYYCTKCLYFNNGVQLAVCSSCSSTERFSFFYEIDLVYLIQHMFEERSLWSKLHRPVQEDDVISDITDGSEYVRITSRADKGEYDLTLILNTDGLSLVKSSKSHCWPLMFMIAELPEYSRESFICIIGLWYDANEKPLMNTFLQPFCEKLMKCFHEGITWVHPITKEKCTPKIIAPLFIADAPARAEIQNVMYFSGKYGCNICEIKTQRCRRVEGKKKIRSYMFRQTPAILRNNTRMDEQTLMALNNNLQHKKGVKGWSIVSALPLVDRGTCVLPEYMHSVLLGVGKQFVNLWIKEKGDWNIKNSITEIDRILLGIRPPHFFNRMPRSLTLLQYFKASEFYNLILFYSLPIFVNHLPDIYLQHWILFVAGLFNLLERSIRVNQELQQSEILLRLFVRNIDNLYGDRQYTYNVHQLLHLVLCVKRCGPLWSTSAFPFENVNGILGSGVHGTKRLGEEMMKNLKIAQGVQSLKVMCEQNQNTSNHSDDDSFQLIKEEKNILTKYADVIEFIESQGLTIENIEFYSRAKINNNLFTSKKLKITKTNSYTVKIDVNNEVIYGEIVVFLKIDNALHLIIQPFTIDHTNMFRHHDTNTVIRHIFPVTETNELVPIKWSNIKSITHMIRVTNYICMSPNELHKVM